MKVLEQKSVGNRRTLFVRSHFFALLPGGGLVEVVFVRVLSRSHVLSEEPSPPGPSPL